MERGYNFLHMSKNSSGSDHLNDMVWMITTSRNHRFLTRLKISFNPADLLKTLNLNRVGHLTKHKRRPARKGTLKSQFNQQAANCRSSHFAGKSLELSEPLSLMKTKHGLDWNWFNSTHFLSVVCCGSRAEVPVPRGLQTWSWAWYKTSAYRNAIKCLLGRGWVGGDHCFRNFLTRNKRLTLLQQLT